MVSSLGFLFTRKKGKAEDCLDYKHLLYTGHYSEHFTYFNSLEPHNNPAMWTLVILLWEMEAGVGMKLVTQLVSHQADWKSV